MGGKLLFFFLSLKFMFDDLNAKLLLFSIFIIHEGLDGGSQKSLIVKIIAQ